MHRAQVGIVAHENLGDSGIGDVVGKEGETEGDRSQNGGGCEHAAPSPFQQGEGSEQDHQGPEHPI